ncbi:MAG: hypothetical protein WC718_12910 [Phycisphaerales bacterium]|jgi:hypothetical protein
MTSVLAVSFFNQLFDTSDYPPRWQCGNWSPFVGWLHIVSDLLIAIAYVAIPAGLFVVVRKRQDVSFPALTWLFIAFILSCGMTHAVEASIFWWPAYRLSGLMKAETAVVSLFTAFAVIRALPEAISLPGVRKANEALQIAVANERQLRTELARTHEELESRTSSLAVRERRMRDAVSAGKSFAICWEAASGNIVWSMGFAEAMRSAGVSWRVDLRNWADLIGPDAADALTRDCTPPTGGPQLIHRRFDLVGHEGEWDLRFTATPEPPVKGQPTIMCGLIGLMPHKDSVG